MADQQVRSAQSGQAEYWNSAASRPWADQYERLDRAVAALTEVALRTAAPQPGERVLDIGCGSGTTVLELATLVGPGGYVLGADIAVSSVARARERILAVGLQQAEVICADVAAHTFAPSMFDLAFSRAGVMFFEDPIAAFANVHRAMKPGGRLMLAVFRAASENPWPSAPVAAVRHLLPQSPPPGPDEPGMFSWADPARVKQILESAGFCDIALAPVDFPYQIAGTGGAAEATEFALLFGPLTRILPSLPPERREAVRSTLERCFESHVTPQGVALPSAFWLVAARA
jgi:SAM-dependent methyltransferase